MTPKNDLFNFFVDQAKQAIKNEMLEMILEFYTVEIKEIDPLPEDRDRWDKQKRFKVIYLPKTMMFNVKLPVFEKEFIISEMELNYFGK